MGELQTQKTAVSPESFLENIDNARRQEDGKVLLKLFAKITGQPGKMWGPSIIGFGQYHYTTADGKTHDMLRAGFSPRKQNLTLYIATGYETRPDLAEQLGKHKTSKACVYINKLADIDMDVLTQLIEADWQESFNRHPT